MSESKLKSKVSSLTVILMLVCSGLLIVLPSTLGSSSVNMEPGLENAQETIGELGSPGNLQTTEMRYDENVDQQDRILAKQLLGSNQIAMIGSFDPVSNIEVPDNNSVVNKVLSILGNVSFNSVTHSITKVEISIKCLKDTKYWDGSGWKTTQTWLSTSYINRSWSYSAISVTWTSGNQYLIQSKVTSNKTTETPSYGNKFTFDNVKPISNINSPINNTVLKTLSSISGNASDFSGSGVREVKISIQYVYLNYYWNGYNWSSGIYWFTVIGTTSWSFTNLPSTWTNMGKYHIKSKASDNAYNDEIPSWGVVFYISSQPANVTSSINTPSNKSCLNALTTISGTSTPGFNTIPTKVEISINRYLTNLYWSGSAWVTSVNWLVATGTTSWSYNSASVTWSSGVKYLIRSRATDNQSKVEIPSFGNIFTYDKIAPTSIITSPVNNSLVDDILNITGTASDTGGSGLYYVQISIIQNFTGYYYDGWYWSNNPKWLTVTGTTNWIYNIITNQTWPPGKYFVKSKAVDTARNVETPSFGNVFTIKAGPNNLLSYINFPGNTSWQNTVKSITGSAYATGGLSVNKVEITIYHTNLNKYWSGSAWKSTSTWLLATGKASWSYNTGSISWVNNNKYHIQSRVTHNASIVENPSFGNIFHFDNIKPSSKITYPANNTVINKSPYAIYYINGTASDTGGSGLKHVKISIKQNSTGKYFNGWSWETTQKWLWTYGTTKWTFKIQTNQTWQQVGKYHIQSRATDNAYNVEKPSYGNNFEIKKSTSSSSSVSSSISSPANNSYVNSVNSISGSASVQSRASLQRVEISIKQVNADSYWHGTAWKSGEHWLLATGTESWTYDSSSVLWSTDTYYNIRSKAIDDEDNEELPADGSTYMFDNVPPQNLNIEINNGAEYTKSRSVTFSLDGEDSGSGIEQMAFSTDGTEWSTWETFSDTKTFDLPSGEGEKIVYLRGKDKAGNIGSDNDKIYLDTTSPSIFSITVNENILYTNTRIILLVIDVKEIASNIVRISFSNDGIQWSDWEEIELSSTRAEGYSITKEYKLPPGDGPKTIYYRIQDSAGNMEEYSTDTIILDTTPPETLSAQINEDAKYTNSETVTLNIDAKDSLSGINEMSFSHDGTTWSDWEPFNTIKSMTLPSGDGEKIIYCRVKDMAENIEQTTDTIILDTSPPYSLSIMINNGAIETNSESVTLTLDASDATSGVYQMSFSSDGITWTSWEPFQGETDFTLPPNDGEKIVYFRVIDNAGNIAEPVIAIIQLKIKEQIIDTDNDGYSDQIDAFPTDPAAAVDSDNDKSPDQWNPGKSEMDSITGLHLDAFPTDPAASIDTDKDGYPDSWNPGMSEEDSTTNLQLDAYPNNPDKYKKSITSEEPDWGILPLVIIIVIIIVCALIFSFVIRNKHHRSDKQGKDDKILNEIRYEILHGKTTNESILSEDDLNTKLEEKHLRGEISENTYYYIKNNK